MNFMNRKMFQRGGASNTLGAYQIRDTVTGEVYDIKPDFINTFGFNPYKILLDDTLEKGSAVQSILEDFQEKDAPKIGPIQARQDIGSTIADVGFRVARQFEPIIRGGIRAAGEITGIEPFKKAGGEFTVGFLPEGEKRLGQPFGVLPVDSVVPSDQERARFMLRGITVKEPNDVQDVVDDTSTFDFRNEDMRSKVGQSAFEQQQREIMLSKYSLEDQAFLRANPNITPEEVGMRPIKSQPTVDVFNQSLNLDELSSNLAELTQEREDLESRFAEEDIQRPADINVDEITSLLDEVTQPSIDIEKTEADTLLDTIDKFDGLSEDQLQFEIDKQNLPGMDALDENKEAVAKQVEVIKKLEAEGEDPDDYLNKAINIGSKENYRNAADKKLNQPGFFGTDRFLNFVRNVGAGLTETGQLGSGLGLGAAKAAEERAARDIAADERKAEMDKLIAIEEKKADLKKLEPMSGADIEKAVKFEDELRTAIKNFDEDERIVSDINQIINEDLNDPDAFGVKGYITKISNDLAAAAGMGAQEWSKLSAAKRTQLILDVTAQRSVRSILGESGKTISNLDREIVAKIFGSVGIFTSPAEIKKKLENSRANIIEGMRSGQNAIISRTQGLKNLKYASNLVDANESIIDRIMQFDFNTISTYKRGDDVSGFTEIDL